ncbi:beta strand repeat-containing protein [Bremerella volcania]|nr:putative Ig domain-containing protein [Bremerella volcania]
MKRRGFRARMPMSEQLESRLVLTASGFPGNDCPPDLDLSGVGDLQIVVGQPFTIDLYANGATAADLDINDNPTGDTIRLVLDPDVGTDTPVGATITSNGVFSWTPSAGQEGTFRIPVIAIDQGTPALADVEFLTVIVSATGDIAPSVDLNGPTAGLGFSNDFTENGGPVAATSSSLTITDPDSTNLESATIVLTNFQDGADEVLAVDTTGTSIVASSYNATTGELTLTGSDTLANYELVLKSLTYDNTSENPTVLDRTIQITVSDGGLSSPIVVSTISIVAENDAPTVDLNGEASGIDFAATFTEDNGPLSIVDAGVLVDDVDNANLESATITLTNVVDTTTESLAVDTTGTSIVANYDSGTGVLTLTGSDTLANYQLVLSTLTYDNTSQNPDETDRIVEVIVNDGTTDSATATITITVEGVNDPPDLDPIQDQTAEFGTLFQITVTATDPEGDVLTFQLDREGIGANIPASATITKTSDTTAVIEWTPSEGDGAGPFTFIVLVIDDDPTTPLADSETFVVTLQTDPPAVDLNGDGTGIDFAAAFTEDAGPTSVVDATATVTDADSTNLASATITITNVLNTDDEFLAVDVTGTSITPSYDPSTGILTLTGSDLVANYQQVIRTLTYDNVSDNPDTTDREIEVIVNDGFSDSAVATITVSVAGENDPPQLTLPSPYDTGTAVEVDIDTEVTFAVTVVDPDDAPEDLIFILDLDGSGIPAEIAQPTITTPPATVPGGTFSWTPSQTGTFTITIIVLDDDGAVDQETFILTVVDTSPASLIEGEPGDSDVNDLALLGVLDDEF